MNNEEKTRYTALWLAALLIIAAFTMLIQSGSIKTIISIREGAIGFIIVIAIPLLVAITYYVWYKINKK